MEEDKIFTNPHRLPSLADELRIFNNDLRIELDRMNEGLDYLGGTWEDEGFKRFKRSLDNLKEELTKLDQEICKREPELKEDAQRLFVFLNKELP